MKEADQQQWANIFQDILLLLRDGVMLAIKEGKLSVREKEKYFVSGNTGSVGGGRGGICVCIICVCVYYVYICMYVCIYTYINMCVLYDIYIYIYIYICINVY